MDHKETDWIENGDMNGDSDMETMEDFPPDMGYRNRKKRREAPLSYLVIGFIAIVCLIAIFAIFFRSCGKKGTEEINSILGRLDQLEEKIPQYAEIGNKIDRLESKVKGLQESMSKSDREGTILKTEFGTLNKQMGILKEEFSSISSKINTQGNVQKKKASQVKGNYHEVQKGETLYGIANKYGMTVEELRSMNNISKGDAIVIYPGQKILVK